MTSRYPKHLHVASQTASKWRRFPKLHTYFRMVVSENLTHWAQNMIKSMLSEWPFKKIRKPWTSLSSHPKPMDLIQVRSIAQSWHVRHVLNMKRWSSFETRPRWICIDLSLEKETANSFFDWKSVLHLWLKLRNLTLGLPAAGEVDAWNCVGFATLWLSVISKSPHHGLHAGNCNYPEEMIIMLSVHL